MRELYPDLLKEIVRRLVECLHSEKIILFGSHAYGSPTEASDIDLMVVVPESDQPRYRRAQEAYGSLWGLTAPVEILVLTRKELEEMALVPASLGYQVLHRGKVVYEKRGRAGSRSSRSSGKFYYHAIARGSQTMTVGRYLGRYGICGSPKAFIRPSSLTATAGRAGLVAPTARSARWVYTSSDCIRRDGALPGGAIAGKARGLAFRAREQGPPLRSRCIRALRIGGR
jgi:Predicted nucleotidyltransferases